MLKSLLFSSVGKKFLMAGSGLVLVLFVIGHLIGNLQIFLGPEALNRYAHLLQSNVALLWPVRLVLLALVVVHIATGIHLAVENRAARPAAYEGGAAYGAGLASRTMLVSGLMVAAFVVCHLLHYTVKVEGINGTDIPIGQLTDPATGHPDVYAMMIAGFSVVPVSFCYLVGVGALCFHLSHGIAAMFQSLGLRQQAYAPLLERAAKGIALALFLGYASIPTSVMVFGLGKAHLQEVVAKSPAPAPAKEVR